MPDGTATARRSGSGASWSSPESPHASIAATRANCEDRSRRRALTRSSTSVGSTAAVPAILTGTSSAHSSSIRRTPDRPARIDSQVDEASPPSGFVVPMPVTTTLVRLIGPSTSGALGALDVGDGVSDGLQVLDVIVGDRDAELLFGGDDHLDHRQRVDVEVVGERLVECDVVGGYAGDLVDDLGEVGADFLGGGHVHVPFGIGLFGLKLGGVRE